MDYVTLLQLADLPGALELAQVASDKHAAQVAAPLMELTLTGGDRSAYTAEQIASADSAKSRIQQTVTESSQVIDGYIGRRYTLPLASVPGILTTWARAITRYMLHGTRKSLEATDPIVRDYKDAIKFLTQVAEGKFSLGLEDPSAAGAGAGDVRIDVGQKVFGREFLP